MSNPERFRPGGLRLLGLGLVLATTTACDSPVDGPLVAHGFQSGSLILAPPPPPPPPAPPGRVSLINFDAAGNALARFDTDGNSIDAHDGEIERFGDRYYLYGASYGCGFELAKPGSPFCGFRVYSSPDLLEWTSHGFLFDGSTATWQRRCNGSQYGCYRPHVAYNASTRRFVLWINTYEIDVGFRVFESSTPTGPFVERTPPTLVEMTEGTRNGDHNLFVDEDGTGYLAYTDWRSQGDLIVEELTPDYLSGTGRHVRLGLRNVEAPSIFERDGRFYLVFGDPNCGYCRTGASYLTASHPLGPWSNRARLVEACGGQPTHVSTLPAADGGTTYLYQGDLWNNFQPNQSTAAHFWAPLEFSAGGEIRRLECAPHTSVSLSGGPSSDDRSLLTASRADLRCDVGMESPEVFLQREARFTSPREGRLRAIALPVYRVGSPTAPLTLEIRSRTGSLQRIAVPPGLIAWNARRLIFRADALLRAGEEYSLRLSSLSREGCYGFAYYTDESAQLDFRVFASRDRGGTWREEGGRRLRVELEIARR